MHWPCHLSCYMSSQTPRACESIVSFTPSAIRRRNRQFFQIYVSVIHDQAKDKKLGGYDAEADLDEAQRAEDETRARVHELSLCVLSLVILMCFVSQHIAAHDHAGRHAESQSKAWPRKLRR